jgi:hypothetical protein
MKKQTQFAVSPPGSRVSQNHDEYLYEFVSSHLRGQKQRNPCNPRLKMSKIVKNLQKSTKTFMNMQNPVSIHVKKHKMPCSSVVSFAKQSQFIEQAIERNCL